MLLARTNVVVDRPWMYDGMSRTLAKTAAAPATASLVSEVQWHQQQVKLHVISTMLLLL
jgi:hypothetical protein